MSPWVLSPLPHSPDVHVTNTHSWADGAPSMALCFCCCMTLNLVCLQHLVDLASLPKYTQHKQVHQKSPGRLRSWTCLEPHSGSRHDFLRILSPTMNFQMFSKKEDMGKDFSYTQSSFSTYCMDSLIYSKRYAKLRICIFPVFSDKV